MSELYFGLNSRRANSRLEGFEVHPVLDDKLAFIGSFLEVEEHDMIVAVDVYSGATRLALEQLINLCHILALHQVGVYAFELG